MNGQPAVVVTEDDLKDMMIGAGRVAAKEVMEQVKGDINRDPMERQVMLLRQFIEDRSTIKEPDKHYASSRHIRMLTPNKNGKPKSVSWFQGFKKESRLDQCHHRPSPNHGRLHEWSFEDIANAWVYYLHQKWMREAYPD